MKAGEIHSFPTMYIMGGVWDPYFWRHHQVQLVFWKIWNIVKTNYIVKITKTFPSLGVMFSKSGGEARFSWREGKTFVGQVTFLDNLTKESIYFSCFWFVFDYLKLCTCKRATAQKRCKFNFLLGAYILKVGYVGYKNPQMIFEFSAERLSENAKSIKITLFAELLTVISPIYV